MYKLNYELSRLMVLKTKVTKSSGDRYRTSMHLISFFSVLLDNLIQELKGEKLSIFRFFDAKAEEK